MTQTNALIETREDPVDKILKKAEEMAYRYLKDKGFKILQRNWKCSAGEVALIVLADDALTFVEVIALSQEHGNLPEEKVSEEKRSRFEKIAISYLAQNPQPPARVRFDIITMVFTGDNQCLLRHHIDALANAE